jgi:hypothetical protein
MNQLKNAINKEIAKDYLGAIEIYEEIIKESKPPLDAFINLSFIYWELASEFSFRDFHKIPNEWGEIGDKKYSEILKKASLIYPNSMELYFWSKYFPHRLFFDTFTENDCLNIIEKFRDDKNIVPFFFLYLFDKEKYKHQRDELVLLCQKQKTAKNIYILSIINNK